MRFFGSFEHFTILINARNMDHGTRNIEHGTRNMEHGTWTWNTELGTWNKEHATRNKEHGTRNMEHAARDTQHGTWNTAQGTRKMEHGTRNTYHGTRNMDMEHGGRIMEHGTRNMDIEHGTWNIFNSVVLFCCCYEGYDWMLILCLIVMKVPALSACILVRFLLPVTTGTCLTDSQMSCNPMFPEQLTFFPNLFGRYWNWDEFPEHFHLTLS